jgi:hypothetical protein
LLDISQLGYNQFIDQLIIKIVFGLI